MQNTTVEPLVTFDLKALREFHETERDVVSVLAGALLASCIKVAAEGNYQPFCHFSPHVDWVDIDVLDDEHNCFHDTVFSERVSLDAADAADQLSALINRVAALGGGSR